MLVLSVSCEHQLKNYTFVFDHFAVPVTTQASFKPTSAEKIKSDDVVTSAIFFSTDNSLLIAKMSWKVQVASAVARGLSIKGCETVKNDTTS